MSTPIYSMGKIAEEKLKQYQSDLIHDGVVIGYNIENEDFIWRISESGTMMVPAISIKSVYLKTPFLEGEIYHVKRPLNDINGDNPGYIVKVDKKYAEELFDESEDRLYKVMVFSSEPSCFFCKSIDLDFGKIQDVAIEKGFKEPFIIFTNQSQLGSKLVSKFDWSSAEVV
ncbi:MAG: hypothetical protein ACLFUH_11460 [Bacteroidales bacterium]